MESNVAFAGLEDITNVIPRNENDAMLFKELADVLTRHDAINRFGIALLHTHFEIHSDESLLEYTDRETRTQTVQPVKTSFLATQKVTETLWRIGENGSVITACNCVAPPGQDHGHRSVGR